MKQDNIVSSDDWKKIEDDFEQDEQIMLEVGQSITGLLQRKFNFTNDYGQTNWGYVIKVVKDDVPKLLFGSAVLNRKMFSVTEGTEVMIERLKDIKTSNNPKTKNYEVYYK